MFSIKGNWNVAYKNMWREAKAVLTKKYIALNICTRKQKLSELQS